MTLSRVYAFWKFVSNLDRLELKRYLEMFYVLKFRELVSEAGKAESGGRVEERIEECRMMVPKRNCNTVFWMNGSRQCSAAR